MPKRLPAVTPEDESWMYQFPNETAQQLHDAIAEDAMRRTPLERGGWKQTHCAFASPTDRRTIEVVLDGPGGRTLPIRFRAKSYFAPGATAGDHPSERYPDVVSRLAGRLVDIAEDHPAGDIGWIEG